MTDGRTAWSSISAAAYGFFKPQDAQGLDEAKPNSLQNRDFAIGLGCISRSSMPTFTCLRSWKDSWGRGGGWQRSWASRGQARSVAKVAAVRANASSADARRKWLPRR